MIRIHVAQINPTIGDLEGNLARILEEGAKAHAHGADLAVFPELCLTGYYPGDLLDEPVFLSRTADALDRLRQATLQAPGMHWVVGAPTPRVGAGKRLENTLLVMCDGEIRLRYAKQLLPTYGIFDERRHFEPGPDVARILRVKGVRVGFLLCEDAWNDTNEAYAINPWERLAEASPDLVVGINASPSHLGKRTLRHGLFAESCRRHGLPMLYVNQVGGHDQVVYDGGSFAVEPRAGVVAEWALFQEDSAQVEFDNGRFLANGGRPLPVPDLAPLADAEFQRRQIILGLRDYARRCGFTKVVVGSSGGIDSALTIALAVEALGAENVEGVTMPSRWSSEGSVSDSVTLCQNLGIKLHTHPIKELVDLACAGFQDAFGQELAGIARENVQARLRGTILMEHSNSFGHLLLTTGNKSEISVGYCTLYGDTNGGLGLIGDLYKMEVFALSRHINTTAGREIVPNAIIDKEPSAELAPGQRDQDSLPPYPVLDAILKDLIEGSMLSATDRQAVDGVLRVLSGAPEGMATIARVKKLLARTEYKRRQAPPILRLRPRAFGSGRQMPIAAKVEF